MSTDSTSTEKPRRLPRGRHGLSREQVESDQRLRIITGLAESVRTRGYVDTPVAAIISAAGVSRETFYQLYDSKLDCFLSAYDFMGDLLLGHLAAVAEVDGDRLAKFEAGLASYLKALTDAPGFARLFLIEVYAVGDEAMRRRSAIQEKFVDAMASVLGLEAEDDRFACRMLVAATATMVTGPLVVGDFDSVAELREPILGEVRRRFFEQK